MAAFSNYLEKTIINHLLRNQAFTPPATVYLALFTATTGLETNAPTLEVSGDTYVRRACALDAATVGVSANTSEISHPQAGATWGTITYWALVDHLSNVTWGTNVNVLMHGALSVPKEILAGDTMIVAAGDLDLTID